MAYRLNRGRTTLDQTELAVRQGTAWGGYHFKEDLGSGSKETLVAFPGKRQHIVIAMETTGEAIAKMYMDNDLNLYDYSDVEDTTDKDISGTEEAEYTLTVPEFPDESYKPFEVELEVVVNNQDPADAFNVTVELNDEEVGVFEATEDTSTTKTFEINDYVVDDDDNEVKITSDADGAVTIESTNVKITYPDDLKDWLEDNENNICPRNSNLKVPSNLKVYHSPDVEDTGNENCGGALFIPGSEGGGPIAATGGVTDGMTEFVFKPGEDVVIEVENKSGEDIDVFLKMVVFDGD